ncbi:MAG TPA: AAA domain-containing protein, partial [Longimicrobiales bacterium]|nr:AAA domain-containing protein [Longimicrobiales bacterium]
MLELEEVQQPLAIQRAKQVFRFLKAYAERNVPTKRRLAEQLWTLMLRDLPDHPSIILGQVADATNGSESEEHGDTPLLVVRRPNLTAPPQPPDALRDWLLRGWESADGQVQVRQTVHVRREDETSIEQFDDDLARRRVLQDWSAKWSRWAESEKPALAAMRVFERLYELHGRIERESEQVELLLGDGRLRWLTEDGPIDHPVLLQRVDLQFDPRVPEFTIIDSDRAPELYGPVLVNGDSLTPEQFNSLRIELETGGYHPLGRAGTSAYLQRLVQQLGARGSFSDSAVDAESDAAPAIARDAVLFLRTRNAGFAAAFERILAHLENGGDLPDSLTSLVGVQPPRPSEVIQDTSSPWGEPPDVLLSKPANLEQIQIARALERHNSVLVQGPPGTGKSHTIANLIGHLVAQGKRVLVTSHTTKALKVLRGQVVDTLQPLCVSVLENDLEGRKQMEEAVKGILSRLTVSTEESLAREADKLAEERANLNADISAITTDLATAREAEYRPIALSAESIEPASAARWIRDHQQGNDWIPENVVSGAALPLSVAELQELYATSVQLSAEEEREISTGLPLPSDVLSPDEFADQVNQTKATEPTDFRVLWARAPREDDASSVDALLAIVDAIGSDVARMVPWQRHIVACGHAAGADVALWQELAGQVEAAFQQWENAKPVLLHHEVKLVGEHDLGVTLDTLDQIIAHLEVHGRFGWFTRVSKSAWKELIQATQVNGRKPSTLEHFRAIKIFAELEQT